MNILKLSNYMTDENTYIVYKEKEAVVIDPGNNCDEIIKKAEGLKIKYIFITHCHYDHIEYLEQLREKTGAELVSSEKGSINIGDVCINLSAARLGYEISAKKSDIIMHDGEEKDFCGIKFRCIYTPGHTNCGVCYVAEDSIFTGDTLFLRSIGRSDLPTGNGDILINSIKNKLYTLDENITCYPGHGDKTTIGYEKKFNLYVKG